MFGKDPSKLATRDCKFQIYYKAEKKNLKKNSSKENLIKNLIV